MFVYLCVCVSCLFNIFVYVDIYVVCGFLFVCVCVFMCDLCSLYSVFLLLRILFLCIYVSLYA